MIYYRLERKYLGKKFTFKPVVPEGQCGSEIALYSRHKRICVSPTIEQCCIALAERGDNIRFVYMVDNPKYLEKAKPRRCVGDWRFTKEAWIKKPTEFTFVKKIKVIRDAKVQWDWKDEKELVDIAKKVLVHPKFIKKSLSDLDKCI